MPDSDLHPDIIRALDVYDAAKPLVAELVEAIVEHDRRAMWIPVRIVLAAGRLEKLFEEENEDGD